MKMTSTEKIFLDKIIADSGQDIVVVRNVLRSILTSLLKEIYASYDNSDNKDYTVTEYSIPYLFNIIVESKRVLTPSDGEKIKIDVTANPALTLDNEITRIFNDEPLETLEYLKQGISLKIINILDFDKDTIIT